MADEAEAADQDVPPPWSIEWVATSPTKRTDELAYRYAILWHSEGDESRPAAIVLQRDDHVLVDAPAEYCIPARFDEPYVVGSINGPFAVTYRPSDAQYFDQVLIELSRMFSIGEQSFVPNALA